MVHVTTSAIQKHQSDNIELLYFQEHCADTDAEVLFRAYDVS